MDRIAIEDVGIPGYTLMSRAGQAAFEDARERFPDARRWLVVCGAGNNAGDGYVIAKLAKLARLDVTVATAVDPGTLTGDARTAWRDYLSVDLEPENGGVVEFTESLCADVDLIVDALLGTGLGRPLTGVFLRAVEAMNKAQAPIMAVDVPSGLDGTSGEVMEAAINATLTVTFVGLKQGLFLGAGPDKSGEIRLHDLEIPFDAIGHIEPTIEIFAAQDLCELLPRRDATAHKGRFGHVLVVGGNHGMGGAARLAGEAALRCGAGLVTVASRPETVGAISAGRPELMCRGIESADELEPLLARATVIALGPGLGQDDWAQRIFRRIVDCPQPKILDADALNLLADDPARQETCILTPHPGEAARLLGLTTAAVQSDRLACVAALTDRYGGVIVLKGRCTLIGHAGAVPYLVDRGNAGMATAGMGDVLTGLTAGMIAQCPEQMHRAAAGAAHVHAVAGDRAAAHGERGLIATDLFPQLRSILNP
jgi:NAD(P)H-hydrate epimerase